MGRQHFPPQLISLPTAPFPQPPLLNADMSLVQTPQTYILIQASFFKNFSQQYNVPIFHKFKLFGLSSSKKQSDISLLGNMLTLSKTRKPLISVAVLISSAFKITLGSSSKFCKCTKAVLSVYIQILTWQLWRKMRTRLRSELEFYLLASLVLGLMFTVQY